MSYSFKGPEIRSPGLSFAGCAGKLAQKGNICLTMRRLARHGMAWPQHRNRCLTQRPGSEGRGRLRARRLLAHPFQAE